MTGSYVKEPGFFRKRRSAENSLNATASDALSFRDDLISQFHVTNTFFVLEGFVKGDFRISSGFLKF